MPKSSPEIAIKVDGVYKDFKLPHEKIGSVKNIFTNMFHAISASQTYTKQCALKNINFEVKKGEFFGIVGRNGSGKSTLLKIIAGIYQPSNGSVVVSGKLVPFIELGVGFNAELTGRENVYLNGALLGFSKKEIDKRYQDIVDFAEIEQFMDQKLKNYSSGMQVRLAFSVATMLASSDILLIDEVLAVGDAAFQRKCFRYFKALKKAGKTVVFVTHDMNAVREYCDKAMLIENQKAVVIGRPDKIAKQYEQLLATESDVIKQNKQSDKWGDNTLTVESPKLTEKNDKKISFAVNIWASKYCDDPITGFVIKSMSGVALFGSNTMLQNSKLPPLMAGEQISVTWTIPNILADGEYTITLAASYDAGTTMGLWWEDALRFSINKSPKVPYSIQPDINVLVGKR